MSENKDTTWATRSDHGRQPTANGRGSLGAECCKGGWAAFELAIEVNHILCSHTILSVKRLLFWASFRMDMCMCACNPVSFAVTPPVCVWLPLGTNRNGWLRRHCTISRLVPVSYCFGFSLFCFCFFLSCSLQLPAPMVASMHPQARLCRPGLQRHSVFPDGVSTTGP